MSAFSHGSYALRCRVCEEVTELEALDACRRCDGPTDVDYDWQQIRRVVTRAGVSGGPPSLWRYEQLLPAAAGAGVPVGWTPLENVGLPEIAAEAGVARLGLGDVFANAAAQRIRAVRERGHSIESPVSMKEPNRGDG